MRERNQNLENSVSECPKTPRIPITGAKQDFLMRYKKREKLFFLDSNLEPNRERRRRSQPRLRIFFFHFFFSMFFEF